MDKEGNYSGNFQGVDYSIDHHGHQLMKPRIGEETYVDASNQLVDYTSLTSHPRSSASPDKMSFADVMQFADFGPRLGLINQTKIPEEGEGEEEEETGIDPVYFLRFPVLNEDRYKGMGEERGGEERGDGEGRATSENNNNNATLVGVGGIFEKNLATDVGSNNKNKRKRARSVKTSEEVESQRMTHIAVERNRRKQMNEHLRVLRSLMPGSYVQRGDQASIIGGAIEFVRELEQLLQCLESQKRRRLYGDPPPPPRPMGDSSTSSLANIPQPPQPGPPPFFPPPVMPLMLPNDHDNQLKLVEFDPTAGIREETAESKSVLADVEVKMLGFDAMIKILSRRRPGQLIKTIAALEDLQLIILHTNITTIEQTVLYSFNVKVTSEARFSAEDIASSVQQIFSFIHANNAPM